MLLLCEVLIDFGFPLKAYAQDMNDLHTWTDYFYIAPEQINQNPGMESDIWAIGVIFKTNTFFLKEE